MNREKLRIAVIGAGMRPHQILKEFLKIDPQITIGSIFDPNAALAQERLLEWKQSEALIASSAEEAINAPGINLVMVFSPNAFHCEHILAAFAAGKAVFSEKPLVTTLEDCVKVMQAHRSSGVSFATGFVLRYTPLYRKVKELIDNGTVGKLLSIDANENLSPRHGAYIMCNWRRFSCNAGPHILEKCCHDLDLINWFIGSVPRRVASFGGRDLFVPENSSYYRRFINPPDRLPVYHACWEKPEAGDDPFLSDKDLYDNQVAILEYGNHVRVQFQATMSNAIEERRMYISGTEGTIIVEMFSGLIRVRRIDDNKETTFRYETSFGHAGGDRVIMEELYKMVTKGEKPVCSGQEGMLSAAVALSIQKSAETGKIIDMDDLWRQLATQECGFDIEPESKETYFEKSLQTK